MAAELARLGHPMLAALLTVGLSAPVQAETQPEASQPAQEAPLTEELELIKEEETDGIASRYEEPISQAPANVYVITDEDIRQTGAPDLPTVLRCIPGIEVMQVTGADFNVSVRGDTNLLRTSCLSWWMAGPFTWTPKGKCTGERSQSLYPRSNVLKC